MPALNRGRATLNDFDVAIKHQRKIVIRKKQIANMSVLLETLEKNKK